MSVLTAKRGGISARMRQRGAMSDKTVGYGTFLFLRSVSGKCPYPGNR